MIQVGLTGWGDHPLLYQNQSVKRGKLAVYSDFFPVVEVDSSFYAIQSTKNYESWVNQTPENFSFVIKAYQGMTGHLRGKQSFSQTKQMFESFISSIEPVLQSGKLATVLFQYPPWFDCKKEHVSFLRLTKELMCQIPIALEFRNQTWFDPVWKEKTLAFMESEGWIHSICDEPQAGVGSVPTVLYVTNRERTLIRFHGRNVQGWTHPDKESWREVRYLYRYSQEELMEWKDKIDYLSSQSKEIIILFNNNSGGDAAENAKEMMDLLVLTYGRKITQHVQLNLFE